MSKIKIKSKGMLYKASRECTEEDIQEIERVAEILHSYMLRHIECQGYAANQVNECIRVAECKLNGKTMLMVNPKVIWAFGKLRSNEGCESLGDVRYIIHRPLIGKVEWCDEDFNVHIRILTFKKLRIVCHEIDHLNGQPLDRMGIKWKYSELAKAVKKKQEAKKRK